MLLLLVSTTQWIGNSNILKSREGATAGRRNAWRNTVSALIQVGFVELIVNVKDAWIEVGQIYYKIIIVEEVIMEIVVSVA